MSSNDSSGWFGFFVHFACGAIFGALFGLYLAAHLAEGGGSWKFIVAPAVIVGLIAGSLGDRFWESFRDSWLNPFRWL